MKALNLNVIYNDNYHKTEAYVVKANDVIPRIIKVKHEIAEGHDELNGYIHTSVNPPGKCPVCGGLTAIKESDSESEILICTNPKCKAKLHARIVQMASRDGFNIVGLSEGTITKILDTFDVEEPTEILNMNTDEIMMLEGFAEKSANNLYDALQKAKAKQPLDRVLYSAAIPLVGRDASKRICGVYSLKELSDILYNQNIDEATKTLTAIKNIGKEIATSLFNNRDMLKPFIANIKDIEDIKKEGSSKEQLSFCITGQREPFKSMIEEAGHKVTGSVSKKTRALIDSSMDISSTKAKKALELNIPIIDTVEKLKELL